MPASISGECEVQCLFFPYDYSVFPVREAVDRSTTAAVRDGHRSSRVASVSTKCRKGYSPDYRVRPSPPALSPREGVTAVASRSIKRIRMFERRATVLPLPWGEGRGEGEGSAAFLTVSLVRSKHARQAR